MGTTIEATATAAARSRRGPLAKGALKLADEAARSCLARAGRQAREIGVLLNAGIYRERSIEEPALAALIQEDIGANPGHPPTEGHGTFSFDVANGAAGVLSGLYLLDGFLRSGMIRLGMVVASDSDPSPGISQGFAFPSIGGAALVGQDERQPGFTAFHFESFPQFEHAFESRVSWSEHVGRWHRPRRAGRNVLTIEARDDYLVRSVDCSHQAIGRFLAESGLPIRKVDLLIATHDSPAFGDQLAERLGIGEDRVVHPPASMAGAHTAAPLVVLDAAMRDGALSDSRTVLFAACGAGITVATALYRAGDRDV